MPSISSQGTLKLLDAITPAQLAVLGYYDSQPQFLGVSGEYSFHLVVKSPISESVSGSVSLSVSNDGVDWLTDAAVLSATSASQVSQDGATIKLMWAFVKVRAVTLTGSQATLSLTMAGFNR